MCMAARGVGAHEARLVTSGVRGVFLELATREEFIKLVVAPIRRPAVMRADPRFRAAIPRHWAMSWRRGSSPEWPRASPCPATAAAVARRWDANLAAIAERARGQRCDCRRRLSLGARVALGLVASGRAAHGV